MHSSVGITVPLTLCGFSKTKKKVKGLVIGRKQEGSAGMFRVLTRLLKDTI